MNRIRLKCKLQTTDSVFSLIYAFILGPERW